MSHQLHPKTYQVCLDIFNHFDQNKDGHISFEEACNTAKAMEPNMSDEEIKQGAEDFLKEIDENNDGRVTKLEWIKFFQRIVGIGKLSDEEANNIKAVWGVPI